MIKHDYDRIYRYICQYKQVNDGNSPTRRKIMEACGVSSSAALTYILESLQKEAKLYLHHGRIHIVGGKWAAPKGFSDGKRA